MDRREFTKTICALGGLTLASPLATIARAASGTNNARTYDVSYMWHSDLNAALDYMQAAGRALGPDVSRQLRLVRGRSGNYGVIYDLNAASWKEASQTARNHSERLEAAGLDIADFVEDSRYEELYNILYSEGPDLAEHRHDYATIARKLGPEARKHLVIEKTSDGQYALVYKRYGDKDSGLRVCKEHNTILNGTAARASLVRESNNEVVYGEASFLHDSVEAKRPAPDHAPADVPHLEKAIEQYVHSLRREGMITADEATSWSVYDFTDETKLVTINEDAPRQCASMMKPFVALAFLHEVRHRRCSYGSKTRRIMERMIQHSSNSATNEMIDLIGGPHVVDRILHDNYPGIFRQTRIVESIPLGGRTYANQASAHDYSRFLYAVWRNGLPYSEEIRRLMALPNRDRLYDGVSNIPVGTLVYHKTGTTAHLCGDFGLLVPCDNRGNRFPYTLVAIIEKRSRATNLSRWVANRAQVIRKVSALVYEEMKRRYSLA